MGRSWKLPAGQNPFVGGGQEFIKVKITLNDPRGTIEPVGELLPIQILWPHSKSSK